MAKPQIENGYTRIANELLEALAKHRIPGEARQILDAIFRLTYGWKRKHRAISYAMFTQMTGLSARHIYRSIQSLKIHGLIERCDSGFCIQKNYEKWTPYSKSGVSQNGVSQSGVTPTPKVEQATPPKPTTSAGLLGAKEKELKKRTNTLSQSKEIERENALKKAWAKRLPAHLMPDVDCNRIDYFLYLLDRGDVMVNKLKSLRAFIKSLSPNGFPDILQREKERVEEEKRQREAAKKRVEAEKLKEWNEQRTREEQERMWYGLPADRQAQIRELAKKALPKPLRDSERAITIKAYEIMAQETTI